MVLTEDRTTSAHLLYQLRDMNRDFAAWAPLTHPQDHYQLTMPLTEAHNPREFILISPSQAQQISTRFSEHERVAEIRVEVEPGLRREVSVWRLQGFLGYR